MLQWALIFFIVAVVAAAFGFTNIAKGAAGIAKILFFIFVVIFLVFVVLGLLGCNRSQEPSPRVETTQSVPKGTLGVSSKPEKEEVPNSKAVKAINEGDFSPSKNPDSPPPLP